MTTSAYLGSEPLENTTLTDCVIKDNTGGDGGGIHIFFSYPGTMTLAGSAQVRRNAANSGGGIYVGSPFVTLEIAETCRVSENTAAAAGNGGGIFNSQAMVTLQGADPSPIVVNNCHENCVTEGLSPVPRCSTEAPVSCPPENVARKEYRT